VEAALPAWPRDRQEATLRTWLQLVPEDVIDTRPVLIVARIGALAAVGQFDLDGDARLDEAERLLELRAAGATAPGDVVVADESQLPALPAAIEMYRAALALMRGDLDGTEVHGRRALEIAPVDDHLERAGATATSLVGPARALVAVHDWTFLVGPGLAPALNAMCLATSFRVRRISPIMESRGPKDSSMEIPLGTSVLYRTRLVPRIIPTLGLIGAPMLVVLSISTLFGAFDQVSTAAFLLALPIATWEFSLGVWMVIKGFRPSTTTSGEAPELHVGFESEIEPALA